MVSQVTARELATRIDSGEPFPLIDTRPRESYRAWHVPGAVNVPYHPRDGFDKDHLERVRESAGDGAVTTICAKGLASTPFAIELEKRGFDAEVVKGGMEDWSKVYETVAIQSPEDIVVRQVQRRAKGCLGYVVGSSGGEAAVFDATRQTEAYMVAAEEAGLTIEAVFDTHVHADHVSGGRRLAEAVDAPYYLGEHAEERGVTYPYEDLEDGDRVRVGDLEIEAIHAPGHTTEMVNYRVSGFLVTGDTLFVESVGRTELQFGDEDAGKGAEMLYDTLHDRILGLPEDTTVLPGHVTVDADGGYGVGAPGEPITATLEDLRGSLELLGLGRKEFVERVTESAPTKPVNFEEVIRINAGGEPPGSEEEATELELGPNNCAV